MGYIKTKLPPHQLDHPDGDIGDGSAWLEPSEN